MTSSNDDIIKAILQYQARLDRYSQNKSEDKMLYVLGKLSNLQIRTLHLENTGIGRTVNALKKLGGAVGEAAKDLVNLWKDMVLEEEKATQETSIEDDADSVYSSENENKDCQRQDSSKENISHSENESEGYGSKPEIPINNESVTKQEVNRKGKNDLESNSRKHNKGDSRNKSSSSSSESSSSSAESEKETYRKRKEHRSRKRSHSYNSSSDERETHHSKKSKNHSSQESHKNKSSTESKKDKHEKSDKHSSSKHKETTEKHKKNSEKCKDSSDRSESKHKSKKDSESESKHKSDKECDEEKKHKHKKDSETKKSSHKTELSKKHEEKENSSHHKHKKQNEKTDKNAKSSHSSKEKESRHSNSDKKEKNDSKKDKKEEKPSESKLKESTKEEKKKESSKSKDIQSSSSKHKYSNSEEPAKKKVKVDKVPNVVKPEIIVHGIDSGSGASFAEALGMCGPLASNPKKKSDKPKTSQTLSRSSENMESEPVKSRKSKSDECGYSSSSKLEIPDLLKEEPTEPLNVCLSSLLPEITPNYKPLGVSFDSQPKRAYTDEEALSRVMTNKNQRTKVYSGNKTVGKVESLFQLCVRVLQDNIDALEYTGGVPYLILKPIMERATADQIFNLEHHNPYLIEDTDELWQLHCQKDFRTKQRQEMESWRDMYMRCLDEREARLNAVKANIKLSQDKSIPVRTTKLAYIDSEFVKPPRNVARKQAKNGTVNTDRKIMTGQKLTPVAQSGEAAKVPVPDPVKRTAERSSGSSSTAMKAKKAPLMAKTISYMKNRFSRRN